MEKYMCPFESLESSFGERIKWLRENENLSLQQVADCIGVTKPHLWELEQGKSSNPCLNTIRRIALFYQLPIASLVEDELTARFRKKKK